MTVDTTITSMLERSLLIECVCGTPGTKRERAPEIQTGGQHAFDYVLKSEESALRHGEGKYTKDGSVYRKK